jgi:hypothetical protein
MSRTKALVRETVKQRQLSGTVIRKKTESRAPALDQTAAGQGLCSTCNHLESCGFRRDTQRPVIECDEFDNYVAPARPQGKTEAKASLTTQDKDDSRQYKGLCVNCGVRETCKLHSPDESIWHCEEYV